MSLEITMQQHGVHRVVLLNLSSRPFYSCLLEDHCMHAGVHGQFSLGR